MTEGEGSAEEHAKQDFKKKNFIGVWLIYNVVLVSGVQQNESVIHISTLF